MKPFLAALFLALPLFVLSQDTQNQHYKIYSTASQKQINLDDIINDMSNADVLFFGEEHTDSIGHIAEYTILKKLADKYPGKTALSMEMFETDCQSVLNEYLKGQIREKDLITSGRAWPTYKNAYRPMIELAKAGGIPVVAANSPARYTHMVTDGGLISLQQLDKQALSYLPPLPIDTATGHYYEKFVNVMGGHSAIGGMKIYQSQNLWDATMGWSVAKFYKSHRDYKIMQVNGGFHSEEKLGAAAQLKQYAPKVRILNIAAYADESFNNPDWTKYKQMGDYIILTDSKL